MNKITENRRMYLCLVSFDFVLIREPKLLLKIKVSFLVRKAFSKVVILTNKTYSTMVYDYGVPFVSKHEIYDV